MPSRSPLLCALAIAMVVGSCAKPEAAVSAEQYVARGWQQFRLEDFEHAEQSFRAALAAVPADDHGLQLDALYGQAMIASLGHHGEQTEQAHALFQQVIDGDHTEKHERAAWAALAMVREQHLPARSDAAPLSEAQRTELSAAYTHIMDTYPQSAAADDAILQRTALRVDTLTSTDAQKAIEDLNAYLASHPESLVRAPLYTLLSTAQETLRHFPEALAAAIAALDAKAAARDPLNPWQNNILEYYRIGMMAQFDVGDFATARRYYQKFLAEYPRDQRAFNVELLLKHLDDTEARLRAGLPPRELSALALPAKTETKQ